jgi:hypothetical protein
VSARDRVAPSAECRQHALAVLDRILAERDPDRVQQAMVEATACVVRYRDNLIRETRATQDAAQNGLLRRTNGVLSLLFGTQYPLQGVHWDRIGQARAVLAELAPGLEGRDATTG